jgi:hypothetical protein
VLGVVVLTASAVFGADPWGVRDRLLGSAVAPPAPVASSRDAGRPTPAPPVTSVLRSVPWWQGVRTLRGAGSMTVPGLAIAGNALQWRATWTCRTGRLAVSVPGRAHRVVDAACPGTGVGYATTEGTTSVGVAASGSWQIRVDQQVDVPLDEAALPAMTAPGAAPVSTGSFYDVDQVGTGTVTLYRLADRGYAVRLAGFYVTPNTDLEVRLSTVAAPRSTGGYSAAPSAHVSFLDVTAGSLNFAVPGLDPAGYRSVVLWCDRLHSVYAAATLTPAP